MLISCRHDILLLLFVALSRCLIYCVRLKHTHNTPLHSSIESYAEFAASPNIQLKHKREGSARKLAHV